MSLIHLDDVVHGKDAESLEHDVRQPRQVQTAETSKLAPAGKP